MIQETKTMKQAIITLSYSKSNGLEVDRVLFIDSSYSSKKQNATQRRII